MITAEPPPFVYVAGIHDCDSRNLALGATFTVNTCKFVCHSTNDSIPTSNNKSPSVILPKLWGKRQQSGVQDTAYYHLCYSLSYAINFLVTGTLQIFLFSTIEVFSFHSTPFEIKCRVCSVNSRSCK